MRDVLIIDDEQDICETVRDILSPLGVRVNYALNLEDAYTKLLANPPHLILLDLHLQEESGFDFLEVRRDDPNFNKVPVVVITAYSDQRTVTRSVGLGASDFVVKPFSAPIFVRKIKKILKSQQFLTYEWKKEERPVITIGVNGNLVEANEVAFSVECPMKVASDTRIYLDSGLMRDWGCQSVVMKTSRRFSSLSPSGSYINDISLVGMNEKVANRIRLTVRRWK